MYINNFKMLILNINIYDKFFIMLLFINTTSNININKIKKKKIF